MADYSILGGVGGGALIGIAAVMLMMLLGRIAGISGIASALLPPWKSGDLDWRLGFVGGLILAPLAYWLLTGTGAVSRPVDNLPLLALSGLLVGFGSVFGSGCTSGHGVCGLARLSPRSLVAVPTFMIVAAAVVYFVRHLLGG